MEPVIENNLNDIGIYKIAGVDEVGRGAGAGYVVAAAVMLPPNHKIEGINDSKKLSAAKREKLSLLITERAIDICITQMSPSDIDNINILNATKACMVEAISTLKGNPEMFVIDGDMDFFGRYKISKPHIIVKKGDTLSENCAASSIIAKTYRDNYMKITAHNLYPQYGFNNHKGYLTKEHIEALYKYGPCPIHRKSFSVKGVYIKDMIK